MRFHHGVLRTKQPHSFWLGPDTKKQTLTWEEYIPFVVLGILLLALFLNMLMA